MAGETPEHPSLDEAGQEGELRQIEREAREDLERANSRLWLSRFLGLGVGALLVSWALLAPHVSDRTLLTVGLIIAVSATGLGFAIAVSSRRRQVHTVKRFTERLQGLAERLQREIQERKTMEARLRDQVRRDPLTGALNHAAFMDELREHCTPSRRPFAVAMIDIDRMKFINDSYGHAIGDEVLTTVANALYLNGAIVGRYGGDEFGVILPAGGPEEANAYRQAVVKRLSRAAVIDEETGSRVPIVASVGLATWPQHGSTPREVINAADTDMYTWKRRTYGVGEQRSLLDEGAARTIGELVPLLTAKISLQEKFNLVAQRLASIAAYDTVYFTVFNPEIGKPARSSITISHVAADLVEAWERETSRERPDAHPIRRLLEQTHRPILIDAPGFDQRLTEGERAIIKAAGLKSVLIVPMIWEDQALGMVAVASKRERAFTARDTQFLSAVAAQITAIARMAALLEEPTAAQPRAA